MSRARLALAFAAALAGAAPGAGQERAPDADAAAQPGVVPRQRLEEIDRAIGEAQSRTGTLQQEGEALRAEARSLERQLIEAAAALQERERELTRLEREAVRLAAEETRLRTILDAERERLGVALAALQRLESERPPALAITPESALDAARGAMLAGAMSARLERDVGAAAEALRALRDVQSARAASRREAEAALRAVEADRAAVDSLLFERRAQLDVHDVAIAAERERLAALAAEADDLRTLVGRILAPSEPSAGSAPMRVAAAGTAPITKAVAEARGRMRAPAAGERIRAFGERTNEGERSQGIVIAARAGAEIVAPHDGRIAFADAYGPLGRVLILALGDGYYFILSGFEEIHGAPGDWVLAGEPVGRLGGARGGGTAAELYVELQKDGKPVDPWVWFDGAGEGIEE